MQRGILLDGHVGVIKMNEGKRFVARTAPSTFVIFAAIFGIPIFFSLLKPDRSLRVLCVVLFCLVMVLISRYRIVIENRVLTYRSMFGERSIGIDEITTAKTEIGIDGPFSPLYRLILKRDRRSTEPSIIINMKVFERRDLAVILEVLRAKMTGKPKYSILERDNRH